MTQTAPSVTVSTFITAAVATYGEADAPLLGASWTTIPMSQIIVIHRHYFIQLAGRPNHRHLPFTQTNDLQGHMRMIVIVHRISATEQRGHGGGFQRLFDIGRLV